MATVRKYLKCHNIYDVDIEEILTDMNVIDPNEDFKTFTQKQWTEFHRRTMVERMQQLKDLSTKARLEKKLEKIEDLWRTQSGIKRIASHVSSNKKESDDIKQQNEYDTIKNAKNKQMLEKTANGLKRFLQKNDCFNIILFAILIEHGVNTESDIENIASNKEWEVIEREFRVLQNAKVKDSASKSRTDKTLKKFEKIWRQTTGMKVTSIQENDEPIQEKYQQEIVAKVDEIQRKYDQNLKRWMVKNGIWQKTLHQLLMDHNISDGDGCKNITEKQFDEIIRKVRVERFQDLKDHTARQNLNKLLVKFEKIWRKQSGIKKTSIKKK